MGDERTEGYGLRRQSAAATALWAAGGSLVLVERSAGLTPKRRRASLAAAVQKVTNNFGMRLFNLRPHKMICDEALFS